VSVTTDPYVDLVPIAPPAPPPECFTVEKSGNAIGKFLTSKPAVELAKTASKDGTEVTIKVGGEAVAGFRNGGRTFTTFEGAQLGCVSCGPMRDALPDYLNPLSPFSGLGRGGAMFGRNPYLGYYGYGPHLGRNPYLGEAKREIVITPRRARMPIGGERPRGLSPHQQQIIDELTAYTRQKILELDLDQPIDPTKAPLTMRGFRGLGAPPAQVERLDTVTIRLPAGAIPTISRVMSSVFATLRREAPELRRVGAATAARARQMLARGNFVRRT
jgi:hypothetical protein